MKGYIVLSVLEIIKKFGDEEALQESFLEFKCEKEKDLEVFLQQKCLNYEKSENCRTFLIIDEEELEKHSKLSIVAFFSITTTQVDIEKVRKKIKGKLLGQYPMNKNWISAFLIGQLGRNDKYTKEDMPGINIIGECFAAIKRAQELIAGRIILVECREKLQPFYKEHGFTAIFKEDGDTYHLYKRI